MAEQEVLPIVEEIPSTEVAVEEKETKSVKNFWERLDEVFNLSKQTNQNLEQILEQFPEVQQINQQYSSSLFQPERISLCSNDDIQPSSTLPNLQDVLIPTTPATGHFPTEYFSAFRVRLMRPLRNVKSMQLLSATIPNATTNIPDSQTFFFYYQLRSVANANQGVFDLGTNYIPGDIVSYNGGTWVCQVENNDKLPKVYWTEIFLPITPTSPTPWSISTAYLAGAIVQYDNKVYQAVSDNTAIRPTTVYWVATSLPDDTTRPNYYDLNPYHLYYVYLAPTYFLPPDRVPNGQNYFNRTFTDYQDLVDALNFCCAEPSGNNNNEDGISFLYDPILNKIAMVPNPAALAANVYFVPCGYEDQNIPIYMAQDAQSPQSTIYFGGEIGGNPVGTYNPSDIPFVQQSLLNTRLGFTWNGRFPNMFTVGNPWSDFATLASLYYVMRRTDPFLVALQGQLGDKCTAPSYPDLVNTSCVRIYADFTFGSTQDSLGSTYTANQPVREGLLSIIPVNASNLGVGFYQNNFNNALTKIPKNITEIGIAMLTDQGLPFYLPNSATVLLELAVEYT